MLGPEALGLGSRFPEKADFYGSALGDATSAQRSTSYAVTRRDGNSTWSWRGRWTGWAVVCRTWSASCLKRAMIAERVRAGLARARSEGKRLGRPPIAPALEK